MIRKLLQRLTDTSDGGKHLPWLTRKVMAWLSGFDAEKYWHRQFLVVRIGNHLHVGANCVVVEDIPDNVTVVLQKPRVILKDKRMTAKVRQTNFELLRICICVGNKSCIVKILSIIAKIKSNNETHSCLFNICYC